MTASLKITESMDSYKKKYEELLHEYQEFAYAVSHDLQAPVRMMQGFTEILLQEVDGSLADHLVSYSDMIKHAGKEAGDALDALLEFSRLNTDPKHFKPLDLNALVATVVEQFAEKIEASSANIVTNDLPPAIGDYGTICRLYSYLISNSLKFRKDGVPPSIEIGANEENGKVTYFVKDNGIGMRENLIEESLIMFRKLNGADEYPGRGAGLTFAKKIVDIHEGVLSIQSVLDEGTVVSFTLELSSEA